MIINFHKALFLCWAFFQLAAGSACAIEPSVQIDIDGLKGAQRQNVERALTLPPGIVRNGKVEERWLERSSSKVPKMVADALVSCQRQTDASSLFFSAPASLCLKLRSYNYVTQDMPCRHKK